MPKLQNNYCWYLGLIFLFSLPTVLADITINEVMYNPKGYDTDAEWIEIYNPDNEWIDFYDGWFIADDKYVDMIQDCYGEIDGTNSTYIIITSWDSSFYESFDDVDILFNAMRVDEEWVPIFDDEGNLICDKIGNNLKNSEDYIELWYCGEEEEEECDLIDFFWYNASEVYHNDTYYYVDADGNGKSLQLIDGNWTEAEPTPGQPNEIVAQPPPEKEIYLKVNTNVFLFDYVNYTKLFKIKIKNKDNCSDKENVSVTYKIYNASEDIIKEDNFTVEVGCTKTADTGNIYFEDAGEYTICGYLINETNTSDCLDIEVLDTSTIACDLSLEINSTQEIYELPEKINFKPSLSDKTYPYKITYWFEDLFGNIVRKKITTLNTNRKSWKPKIDESDKVFLIKANLSFISCNDTDPEDDSDEKLVIVTNPEYFNTTIQNESYVKIVDISLGSDNKAKFGEAVNIKINIYRGNTAKYSTSLWAEGSSTISSKTSKIHTLTKFTNYTFTIPVQLKPNCNENYDDGNYYVKLEGLDSSDSATIKIEGITSSLCEESSSSSSSSSSKSKFSFKIISLPDKIEIGKEFTAKVKIISDDDEHILDIWSYVYRGNKCYSGEREANIQSVTLPEDSSVIVELKNTVTDAEPGSYNFKVKLRKDNQKTLKELTEPITFAAKITTTELSETNINQRNFCLEGNISKSYFETSLVYESSSEKTKKLIYGLILGVLFLIIIVLIWRK